MTEYRARRALFGAVAALIACVVGLGWCSTPVHAQAPGWSAPEVLTPDQDIFAVRPLLAVDPYGRLHAIWTEGVEERPRLRLYAIYYSVRDAAGWSEPVDILAAAGGNGMDELKGFVATPSGHLVVAWSEAGQLWVAQARSEMAASVRAWRAYSVDAGSYPSLVASESELKLFLAYWRDPATLLVIRSDDDGQTWSAPVPVWEAGADASGSNVVGLVAQDGALHLVWAGNTLRRTWRAEAIWHARMVPTTGELSVREVARSVLLEEPTLDAPSIAACPDGDLHIVWNNGIGSRTGRFHQWWSPAGNVWSPVQPLFPGLSGQTGKPGLVCDNTGRVHLLTAAAGDESSGSRDGLRYATWQAGAWSPYETLWGGEFAGERPHLAIVGGNHLHLVWHFFYLDGEVVHMVAHASRPISAPPVETMATVAQQSSGVVLAPYPQPTRSALQAPAATADSPVGVLASPATSDNKIDWLDGMLALVLGGASSVVVLAVGLAATRARKHR